MALHGDRSTVGRPARRVELRFRLRDEGGDLRLPPWSRHGGRLQSDQHQIALARPVLDRGDRVFVRREIRIEQPRAGRDAPDTPARAIERVEIRVEARVSPQLVLIEINRLASDRRRRTQGAPRDVPGRRAVERDLVERREVVRRSQRVDHFGRAGGARGGQKARADDGEALVRQPPFPIVHGRGRSRGDGALLVVAPQIAERASVHLAEDARRRVRDAPCGRLRELAELLFAVVLREIGVKADPVGVLREAVGPVGQPAVDAIERLQRARPRRFVDDRREVSRVQATVTGDRRFLVRRESFYLPARQEQIRERVRHASEDIAGDARPTLRAIEMDHVCELVGEDERQPVVEAADEFGAGGPDRVDDNRVARQHVRVAVRHLGLIDEHHVCQRRRFGAERTLELAPRLFGDDREPPGHAVLALMEVDEEVLGRQAAERVQRIEERRRARRARADAGDHQEGQGHCQRASHGVAIIAAPRRARASILEWRARGRCRE